MIMRTMGEHADNFSELEPEVRDFLDGLRPEEVKLLQDGIRMVQAIRTVSRFVKWLIIVIVGTFIGVVTLGDAILKARDWFR